MQLTPSVGFSVIAALVGVGVTAFAWQRRRVPGAVPLAAFTAGTVVWTAGNALQAASTTLSAKLFWVNVQYVGLSVVPIGWFAFACEYTGRDEWVNRRTIAALTVYPAVLLVLSWTNQYHHLLRESSRIVTVRGFAVLHRTFGPLFWTSVVYSNLVNGVGTVLLLRGLLRSRRLYRLQTLAVLAGTTVPWVAATLFYNGLTTVEPEVFFSVTGVAFAYAIAKYDLLDVVPVGRATVVEEMDDCVLVLDADDRIVDANPAATRAFGWPNTETVIGQSIGDACASCGELVDSWTAGEIPDEVVFEDAEGKRRYFDVQSSGLSERSSSGTVLILRDVTTLRRHENRLERQNQRLERVGQTIAHDLRNPLNVAKGHLELAAESDTHEHLAEVEDAHDRMDDIIEEILGMARDERTEQREWVDLGRVAESAWGNVETGDATLELDRADHFVLADDGELTSAFENLFRNAVEHGPTSSQPSTDDAVEHGSTGNRPEDDDAVEHGSTSSRPQADDAVEYRDGDVTVRVGELDRGSGFYVADDGPGVPEEDRERVFEAGYTTNDDGTGVGLAVVGDVVERHGWTVEVTESDMGGARFELRDVEIAPTPTPTQ